MPIATYIKIIASSLLACAGQLAQAHALSFGELTVHSYANERFAAVVVVKGFKPNYLSMTPSAQILNHKVPLIVRMTPAREGVDGYLEILSRQPIEEPIIELEVELSGSTWRITKQYTALPEPRGDNNTLIDQPPEIDFGPLSQLMLTNGATKLKEIVPVKSAATPTPPKPQLYLVKKSETLKMIIESHFGKLQAEEYEHVRREFLKSNKGKIVIGKSLRVGTLIVIPETFVTKK